MNQQAMLAIFKRDLRAYFGNPTGYVFIVLFVVATGLLAYPDAFFNENKANLDLLGEWFPRLIVLLAPAMTMAAWASEYRQGTDQLLLTLPAQDPEVVLAKFGACCATYTIALAFTLFTHLLVLEYLGNPDWGLLFGTYLGFWLMGAAFVAVGMLASSLTSNQTLAFVFGVVLCGVLAISHKVVPYVGAVAPGAGELIEELSAVERFGSFTRGVVAFEDLVYFGGIAGVALFANTIVLSRRHWTSASGHGGHSTVRVASVAVGALSFALLVQQAAARVDVTSARMLSLTPEAKEVLDGLSEDRPVTVEAWISPKIPAELVGTRDALVRMLRELDARGGDKVNVVLHETELFSEEAERAETLFKIKPERVATVEAGRRSEVSVFMGLAFRCGARELTIPFFHRDLPVQYELTRMIGAAANVTRKKVGVTTGGLNIFGGFDFNTMGRNPRWQVLDDLAAQYEVTEVAGTAPIDTSLDVLVVPLPSSLPQEHMDHVAEYVWQGGNVLFLVDSFPYADLEKAPMRPPGAGRNPFQQPQRPEPERGDLTPLMTALGVSFPKDRVVWDAHNPHPEFDFPKEVVILTGQAGDRPSSFNEADPITAGLQEVLLLFPGGLEVQTTPEVKATTLLRTGPQSGWHRWDEMVQESFFGIQPLPPDTRLYQSRGEPQTLAVRLSGKMRAPSSTGSMKQGELGKDFDAIVVADLDLISDGFYSLRRDRRGEKSLPELDNVTFIANCIDALAGEDAYLELRKLRPKHRTLARLEAFEATLNERKSKALQEAKDASKKQLEEAQKRFDDAIAEIEKRTDLDRRTKNVMVQAAREREQRRLDAEKRRIEDAEKDAVRRSEMENSRLRGALIGKIQAVAWFLPPIPVLLLGVFVFWRKVKREREGIPARRRRAA